MPIINSGFMLSRSGASPNSAANHREVVLNIACIQIATSTLWPEKLKRKVITTDSPVTMENFAALKRLGFAIVLDDFGTGYSSLRLLHRFRVDKIKIDRSFVADLGQSVEAETLVGAIVKLARSFHLGVIAEGVETEIQKDLLIAAGCHEFQGYLTGRPTSLESVAALFANPAGTLLRA